MGCDRGKNDLGSDDVGVNDTGYFDLSHDDVGHDGGGYKKVDRDNKLVRYYDVQNLDRPKEQDDDYNELGTTVRMSSTTPTTVAMPLQMTIIFFGGMVGPKQARTTEKHQEILGRKNSS